MALISCPECGNKVSDHAKVCVNCGYPIESSNIVSQGEKCDISVPEVNNNSTTKRPKITRSSSHVKQKSKRQKWKWWNWVFLFIAIYIVYSILSFSVGVIKDRVQSHKDDAAYPLLNANSFISDYNQGIQKRIYGQRLYGSEKYIDAAKQLMSKTLKNPSSAVFNDAKVVEYDSNNRGIVYLDISAENSLGGYTRNEYYVCILNVTMSDFEYNRSFFYTEASSGNLETLKTLNDFGVDELAPLAELCYISDSSILKVDIENEEDIESFSCKSPSAHFLLYMRDNQLIGLQIILHDGIDIDKRTMIAEEATYALRGKSTPIGEVYSFLDNAPAGSGMKYDNGFLYACDKKSDTAILTVMRVDQREYKHNKYWMPSTDQVDQMISNGSSSLAHEENNPSSTMAPEDTKRTITVDDTIYMWKESDVFNRFYEEYQFPSEPSSWEHLGIKENFYIIPGQLSPGFFDIYSVSFIDSSTLYYAIPYGEIQLADVYKIGQDDKLECVWSIPLEEFYSWMNTDNMNSAAPNYIGSIQKTGEEWPIWSLVLFDPVIVEDMHGTQDCTVLYFYDDNISGVPLSEYEGDTISISGIAENYRDGGQFFIFDPKLN